ncbi:MAG TPA: hypothetical protein EYH44_00010 [Thermoprotei archaeon]|nr:hypothetical protein [Thermoprotei archaeon]
MILGFLLISPINISSQTVCTTSPGDTLESLVAAGCTIIVLNGDLQMNSDLNISSDLILRASSSLTSKPSLILNGKLTVVGVSQFNVSNISIIAGSIGSIDTMIELVNVDNVFLEDIDVSRSDSTVNTTLTFFKVVDSNIYVLSSNLGEYQQYLRGFHLIYSGTEVYNIFFDGLKIESERESILVDVSNNVQLEFSLRNGYFPLSMEPFEIPMDAIKFVMHNNFTGDVSIDILDISFDRRGSSGIQDSISIYAYNGLVKVKLGENISTPFFLAGTPPKPRVNPIGIYGFGEANILLSMNNTSYLIENGLKMNLELYNDSKSVFEIRDSLFDYLSFELNASTYDSSLLNLSIGDTEFRDVIRLNLISFDNSELTISFKNVSILESVTILSVRVRDLGRATVNFNDVDRRGVGGTDPIIFLESDTLDSSYPNLNVTFEYVNDLSTQGRLFQLFNLGESKVEMNIRNSVFNLFSIFGGTSSYFDIYILDSRFQEAYYDNIMMKYVPLDISGEGEILVEWSFKVKLREGLTPIGNHPFNVTFMGNILFTGVTDNNGESDINLQYYIYNSRYRVHQYVARRIAVISWVGEDLIDAVLGRDFNFLGPKPDSQIEVSPSSKGFKAFGYFGDKSISVSMNGRKLTITIVMEGSEGTFIRINGVVNSIFDYDGFIIIYFSYSIDGKIIRTTLFLDLSTSMIRLQLNGTEYILTSTNVRW